MNRVVHRLLCLSACIFLLPSFQSGSDYRLELSCPAPDIGKLYRLNDLRSAFLQRQGPARYHSTTPEGIRAELQRHFDVVLLLLKSATNSSIEKVLDRLQVAQHET